MKFVVLPLLFLAMLCAQSQDLLLKSQQAKAAIAAAQYPKAIALYEELVRALPDNPGMRLNLGLALQSAGRYREAIQQLETVLRQQPDTIPAQLLLGLAYQKLNQPADAIAPLEKVVRAEPGHSLARFELADALLRAGRPKQAAGQFRTLAEADPASAKAWQGLGMAYVAWGQQAFARLEEMEPRSARCDFLFARSLLSRGRSRSAFRVYREALAKAPRMRGIHAALADVYTQTGHPEWAREEQERERALGQPDCRTASPECDYAAGRDRDLLDRPRPGKSPDALFYQALACSRLADQAFAHLAQLPPSSALHELLADAYRVQGKMDLSAAELEKTLQLAPGDRRLKRQLAVALKLGGQHERARRLLVELLRDEPESAQLNRELGDTLLRMEHYQESVRYLERACTHEPADARAQGLLGYAYMKLDRPQAAIPHLKAALAGDQEGQVHYRLAQAYRQTGKEAAADAVMRQFKQLYQSARARRDVEITDLEITPP